MRTRVLTAGAAALLIAAGGGGAAAAPGPATYLYDVTVSGSVLTREAHQGVQTGEGTIELRLAYEIVFRRVSVRVTPVTPRVRVAVTATRSGAASGRFSFDSRIATNVCAGGFNFTGLAAPLTLNAYGPRVVGPRFVLQTSLTTPAEDSLLERIEKAEGACPRTRPGRPLAPTAAVPAGPGIRAIIGSIPGGMFRRETWTSKSLPLAQLLAGRPFTLDTRVRTQALPDFCEPGTCTRNLSGRLRVTFRRV